MFEEDKIGGRIREMRKQRKMTLDDLAQKADLSKSYLSRVENTKRAPPVSTLSNIAQALGVGLSELLGEGPPPSSLSLVKKSQRQQMARDASAYGYSYETLTEWDPSRHMEPFVLTVPPVAKALFQHQGEEMMYILEGSMELGYGDSKIILEEGDCVYFDASVPHSGASYNCEQAKCLIVIYGRENHEVKKL